MLTRTAAASGLGGGILGKGDEGEARGSLPAPWVPGLRLSRHPAPSPPPPLDASAGWEEALLLPACHWQAGQQEPISRADRHEEDSKQAEGGCELPFLKAAWRAWGGLGWSRRSSPRSFGRLQGQQRRLSERPASQGLGWPVCLPSSQAWEGPAGPEKEAWARLTDGAGGSGRWLDGGPPRSS